MNIESNYADLYRKVKELENDSTRISDEVVDKVSKCEAKYQAILDTVDAHLTLIDRDFTVVWANHNARNLFGDSIVGRHCHEVCLGNNNPCGATRCIVRDAFVLGLSRNMKLK